MPPIILAGAFPLEINGIMRRGRFRRAKGCCFEGETGGVSAILAVSGMGEDSAYRKAKEILALYPDARAYVSVGLSASLALGLVAGDIIAATEITSYAVISAPALSIPGQAPSGIQELRVSNGNHISFPCNPGLSATLAKIECRAGRFASVSRTITTSAEKKKLADATGAVALDMESGGAARACAESGIPFISIRAISDTLEEDLPVDFNLFMNDGKMRLARLMFYLLAHPARIPALLRLGRNSRLACERLGESVESMMGAL